MTYAGDAIRCDSLRARIDGLRAQLVEQPLSAHGVRAAFEAAAGTARNVAADCLPLGIAVVMHLYPLCALRAVPLPALSHARFKRARLLRTIRSRGLILANAGSERVAGVNCPLRVTPADDGIRVDGTLEYVSLASVADVVLFSAPLAKPGCGVFCAADLRGDSVRIGARKFPGSMQLSDTCPVTFVNHRVAPERYLLVPDCEGRRCIADYQRCWFQMLLVESCLARIVRLHTRWPIAHSTEEMMSLNELGCLREHSLRLLEEFSWGDPMEPLVRTTAAMKLRASQLAQATSRLLRELAPSQPANAERLMADASELGYIRSQPTADEKILRDLGCAWPALAAIIPAGGSMRRPSTA